MSDEYMTGEELFNLWADSSASWDRLFTKAYWNEFAERLKHPRPKKPPTLEDVYDEWNKGVVKNANLEDDVEDLRQRLNAAREAIDAYEGVKR